MMRTLRQRWKFCVMLTLCACVAACNSSSSGGALSTGASDGLGSGDASHTAPAAPPENLLPADGGGSVAPAGGTAMPVPIELPANVKSIRLPTHVAIIPASDAMPQSSPLAASVNVAPSGDTLTTASVNVAPDGALIASATEATTHPLVAKNVMVPKSAPTTAMSALPTNDAFSSVANDPPIVVFDGARGGAVELSQTTLVANAALTLLDRFLAPLRSVQFQLSTAANSTLPLPIMRATSADGATWIISFHPDPAQMQSAFAGVAKNALAVMCQTPCAQTNGDFFAGAPLCYQVWRMPHGSETARRAIQGVMLTLPTNAGEGIGCMQTLSSAALLQTMYAPTTLPIATTPSDNHDAAPQAPTADFSISASLTDDALYASDVMHATWIYTQSQRHDRALVGVLRGDVGATPAMQHENAHLDRTQLMATEVGAHPAHALVSVSVRAHVVGETPDHHAAHGEFTASMRWRRDAALLVGTGALQFGIDDAILQAQHTPHMCIDRRTDFETYGCPAAWNGLLPIPDDFSSGEIDDAWLQQWSVTPPAGS